MTSKFERLARRYMLQHAHPMKFTAEVLGVMWSVYFLWRHQWILAAIAASVLFFVSTLLLWRSRKRLDRLAGTPLGKMMLVYAAPTAFAMYNLSAFPAVYGVWTHQPLFILVGISMLLAPHL